jgi:hypothetical protein
LFSTRDVDQQILDIRYALAQVRLAPNDHIEDLLFFKDAADVDTRDQNRRGTAYITGTDAILLSRGQIDLDLE